MNLPYLRSLPLLFGRPVLADFARTGRSGTFTHLAGAAGFDLRMPVARIYDAAYAELLAAHRCEYVFKNVIARRLLIERHPWAEARLLTEFRVGMRKADVVILNGTSTVYEIKTGLDNLDRLAGQLDAYRAVFDRIYVVCEAEQAERIAGGTPVRAGIIALENDGSLTEVRQAESNAADTDPETMLAGLRKAEYLAIVQAEAGELPNVSNGRLWGECVRLARGMDPVRVHAHMVRLLRSRKLPPGLQAAVETAPDALAHAVLTLGASARELDRLADALAGPAVN